jgi:PH (Pleckstrin Homology) domain-containing protein
MWIAAGVLWVLSGGALLNDRQGAGLALVAGALLLAGLCFYYRRRQPLGYRIAPEGLIVVERGGERRIDGAVANPRDAGLGLRIYGSGGLYGYLGRFRLADRAGTARAFVSDRRRVRVVDVGDGAVAVSPADPDAFCEEARHA